jgi:hypothetical protein
MRTSRPPFIASWILHRFGARPDNDAIAGDLLEQYQHGRSRLWYWREIIVAILTGAWSEARQHRLSLLVAIAMAWILDFVWQKVMTPLEYSVIVRYVIGGQARLDQIAWVGFLIEAPLAVAMGWTTARFAQRCRIPAVFGLAVCGLLVSTWTIWKNAPIVLPGSLGYHFSVWAALWPIPLMTVLVLFGGGLLTGSPKRQFR